MASVPVRGLSTYNWGLRFKSGKLTRYPRGGDENDNDSIRLWLVYDSPLSIPS